MLGFCAFPPFEVSILGWFALVPLLLAVKGGTTRSNFLYGYVAGLVFFGSLLYWLVNVTVPGMIIVVLMMAVYYAVFAVIAGFAIKYSMDLFLLPFAWVVLEYIRSHLFSGFPWGGLGYSQYRNINMIQIADITGAYGVSFVMIAFSAAVYALLTRSKRKMYYMMVALLFMIISTSYGVHRFNNLPVWASPRISVVQANIPQEQKWSGGFEESIIQEYAALTELAAEDSPDMIIWPETAYPYLISDSDVNDNEIDTLAAKLKIPLLAGIVYGDNGRYYNSAVLYEGSRGIHDMYYKTHLVPFGEYIPLERYISFIRKNIDKPIGDFARGDKYTLFPLRSSSSENGEGGTILRQTNFFKFGVLICFEDIFPYIAREFAAGGANILINITNDAWFGPTAAARQHLAASVFRAVENRVPVVRAANTGVSGFIEPTGRIISTVNISGREVFVQGIDTASVTVVRSRTHYTAYGDIFVFFCGIMMLVLFLTEAFFIKKEQKD